MTSDPTTLYLIVDKWYLILNLDLRVIHISNSFEEHTGYNLNDYKDCDSVPTVPLSVPTGGKSYKRMLELEYYSEMKFLKK